MKETHEHIDKLVRDQLGGLPPETAPARGWDALERRLDASTDEHLRNTLTGLAAGDAATGWQALENKLDVQSLQDARLADQLNSLQDGAPAGSWAILAKRMDGENDRAVDGIVTDGLARTTPVSSSGWAALAARLELIGWRRSTVAAWKVTEGALLMSLILLFLRFGPEARPFYGPVAKLHDGFPVPMTVSPTDKSGKTNTEGRVVEPLAVRTLSVSGTSRVVKQSSGGETSAGSASIQIPLVLPTAGEVLKEQPGSTTSKQGPYLPAQIASLDILPLKKRISLPSPLLNLAMIDHSVPSYYYANAFVSPLDVNQVVTPGHLAGEYNISNESRYTTGFTAGGLLDINKGRSTLQIGVIYSRRAYLPASLKWRYQDYFTPQTPVEGYSKFVYHAIEFPFNYKHTLAESNRWRVAARVGMSLSVIAKPVIKDQEEVVAKLEDFEDALAMEGFGQGRNFPAGLPSAGRSEQTDFSSESKLKGSPEGWFEGGSMLANSSFYLGGGVTVERILNPRWSLYLSPSFGRVIYLRPGDGIGPYRDRIHLGSLRMGSRYRFGGSK